MTKTILLSGHNIFTPKTNRIFAWVASMIWLLMAISSIVQPMGESVFHQYRFAFGLLMIPISIFYAVYAYLGFSKKSKWSAKMELSEKLISIRKQFLGTPVQLLWKDISSIEFSTYQVKFNHYEGPLIFNYSSDSRTSIQIKQAIREFALLSQVQVEQ